MNTMTGIGSSPRRSGVVTFSVKQSSPIDWYLPTPSAVYMRCCGAQLPNPWQCRTPGHGCTGRGARNRSGPVGAWANGMDRHRCTPSRVKPSTVPEPMVARTTCSCITRPYRMDAPRCAWPLSGGRRVSLAGMRIAVLIAASVLVGGCSQGIGGNAGQTAPSPPSPSGNTSTPRTATPTSTMPPGAPQPGAAVADVIAFVESGQPAGVNQFHAATRDGTTTQLGEDVAFTTPSGTSNCMTDSQHFGGALACLVELTIPPLQPPDVYGQWKGGWVDFAGSTVEIGSAHGDPGRFASGTGPQLPYGQA